jgi:hypothetical protein
MRHESSITSPTLVAVTPCRVAAVQAAQLDRGELQELAKDRSGTLPDRS